MGTLLLALTLAAYALAMALGRGHFGLFNLSRNLGLITGASVMGAVFAVASAATDITFAHPEAVASGMRTTFGVAAALIAAALAITIGPRIRPAAR